jgi:hypothetical protein
MQILQHDRIPLRPAMKLELSRKIAPFPVQRHVIFEAVTASILVWVDYWLAPVSEFIWISPADALRMSCPKAGADAERVLHDMLNSLLCPSDTVAIRLVNHSARFLPSTNCQQFQPASHEGNKGPIGGFMWNLNHDGVALIRQD